MLECTPQRIVLLIMPYNARLCKKNKEKKNEVCQDPPVVFSHRLSKEWKSEGQEYTDQCHEDVAVQWLSGAPLEYV